MDQMAVPAKDLTVKSGKNTDCFFYLFVCSTSLFYLATGLK